MSKWILVSQGIKIGECETKEDAEEYVKMENEDWLEYKQECIDNCERYADNEIFIYEEN